MTRIKAFRLLIGFAVVLFACSAANSLLSTPTPALTETPESTETPAPSKTPTPEPFVVLTRERISEGGGFSYHMVKDWVVDEIHGDVYFYEPETEMVIEILVRYVLELNPLEENIQGLIDSTNEFLDSGEAAEWFVYSIDGHEGLAFDYHGEVDGDRISGRTILVHYGENMLFYADLFAREVEGKVILEEEGFEVVDEVMESIELHEVDFVEGVTPCEVSKDEDYGYSKNNPIFIGGGALFGNARVESLFGSLMGPNGQQVRHFLVDTIDYQGSYLRVYEVWHLGMEEEVTIYINENRWKEGVMAPKGFRCMEPFPFGEP